MTWKIHCRQCFLIQSKTVDDRDMNYEETWLNNIFMYTNNSTANFYWIIYNILYYIF